ncbi:thiosulfate sulfurtransferase/rhodanese-like domain-containing protein 3 [Salminus brasiliensis]|uniref:thiosulfate sulfurtransferase/rhodanese-like domain-containing protein 3 n=1 Tax=Salminus brasiliensis TaxID=930266 RepID=UPI003B82DF20
MALRGCCRLTRCLVRVVESRNAFFTGSVGLKSAGCLQYSCAIGKQGHPWRSLSSASQSSAVVTYEELKKLLVARSGVVIDVREPWELREYGNIPGSINVPLEQVNGALQLEPEEFKEKYGGDMPSTTENIVFTCLAGMRSVKALQTAMSLGYSNAQHYPGGWQDWAKHEILQTKE